MALQGRTFSGSPLFFFAISINDIYKLCNLAAENQFKYNPLDMKSLVQRLGDLFVLVFIVCFPPNSASAQGSSPLFYMTPATVPQSSSFKYPVKVKSFNGMVGIQFSINWDSTKLSYKGLADVDSLRLGLNRDNNFGEQVKQKGTLSFTMIDLTLQGKTVPDTSTIFSLVFEALGNAGTETEVVFSDKPTMREVSDRSLAVIKANWTNSKISFTPSTSNTVFQNGSSKYFSSWDCFPNPSSDQVTIAFTSTETLGQVQYQVMDMLGRVVWQQQDKLGAADTKRIVLPKETFTSAGAYLFTLQSASISVTQQILIK